LFALILIAVTSGRTAGIDHRWVRDFRDLTGGSAPTFQAVSAAGGPAARTLIVAVVALGLLILRRPWSAAFVAIAVAGTGFVDALAKLAVGRPRPHLPQPVAVADGYAFPSGHASGSLALAIAGVALVWHLTRSKALTAIAAASGAAFALLVGVSRVALGVHYPSDVIAAYALAGACVLAVLFMFTPRMAAEGGRAREGPVEPGDQAQGRLPSA